MDLMHALFRQESHPANEQLMLIDQFARQVALEIEDEFLMREHFLSPRGAVEVLEFIESLFGEIQASPVDVRAGRHPACGIVRHLGQPDPRSIQRYAASEFFQKYFSAAPLPFAVKYSLTILNSSAYVPPFSDTGQLLP